MATSSSSTKKAAKLAQKGKGRRVRFQGGTLFPMIVSAVLVLGLALVVYARTSRPAADASSPMVYEGGAVGDHWHGAYGFQLCSDTPNVQLVGDLEERDTLGRLISQDLQTTGIHSHNDGVIHWHAWSSRAAGRNAKIKIFLDNYDVGLSNTKLELPAGTGDDPLSALTFPAGAPEDPEAFPLTYEEGETECDGEDASLKVVVWDDFRDPDSERLYESDFGDIRFDKDGIVIVIAFVPDDVEIVMPEWASRLPELGAADGASAVVPDDTVVLPESTEPGATGPQDTEADDRSTDDSASEDTAPEDTAPEDTGGGPDTTEDTPETTEG